MLPRHDRCLHFMKNSGQKERNRKPKKPSMERELAKIEFEGHLLLAYIKL